MDCSKISTVEPGKTGGKPSIRGLQTTVYGVSDYLASGIAQGEILAGFPDLTREGICTCVVHAANRKSCLAGIPHEAPV
jgi:uncharacterized protein (DUF433 family)